MDYTTIETLAVAQNERDADGSSPLVRAGASFRRYGAREGAANPVEVEVLTPSSLGRHGLRAARFERLVLDMSDRLAERIDEFATREGDVVMSLSPPFRAIYVGPGFKDVLISTGMVLLREDEETARTVDPRYLAGWLSSETVARRILPSKLGPASAVVRQRARRRLSVADLLDVAVPLLPMEEQRRLGELVVSAARSEVRHRAQRLAEDRVVESCYWRKCVEAADEGEVVMDDIAGEHLAGTPGAGNAADAIRRARGSYPADAGGADERNPAARDYGFAAAESVNTTSGNGYSGAYANTGNGYATAGVTNPTTGNGHPSTDATGNGHSADGGASPASGYGHVADGGANAAIPDFLGRAADNVGTVSTTQGALSLVPDPAGDGSPAEYDRRQMERLITPEWYEGYIQSSTEASERFLDSFRAIAETEGRPEAPPGEVRAGPDESPPRAYGTYDDSEGPPGYDRGGPYDVRVF